jgi:hypothetical protein
MEAGMIIASAIKLPDGQIFVGKRHGDAGCAAYKILGIEKVSYSDTGFLTSNLEYLDRKAAYKYAKKTGQFKRKDTGNHGYNGKELYSEDLW